METENECYIFFRDNLLGTSDICWYNIRKTEYSYTLTMFFKTDKKIGRLQMVKTLSYHSIISTNFKTTTVT